MNGGGTPRWRLGISQGRLVPSATGELQCFPGERWPEEFETAARLGLHHIELLAEVQPNPANPIWSPATRADLLEVAERTGVAPASLCIDETLDVALDRAGATALRERFTPVLDDLPLDTVVLPLMGASDLSRLEHEEVAAALRELVPWIAERGAIAVVETTVEAERTRELLEAVGCDELGVCLDLGNAVANGFDPVADLDLLGPRVRHLHVKDKDAHGENVRLGTGRVDFDGALAAAVRHGFAGLATMETTRGDDPVATAAAHVDFVHETLRHAVAS